MNMLFGSPSLAAGAPILGLVFAPALAWTLARKLARRRPGARRPRGKIVHANIVVTNPEYHGKSLQSLDAFSVVFSRIKHRGHVGLARPDTTIHLGDRLLAVGTAEELNEIRILLGRFSREDLRVSGEHLVVRRGLVTRPDLQSRLLGSLRIMKSGGIKVTRVSRDGEEFLASPSHRLQLGDIVSLVGSREKAERAAQSLGRCMDAGAEEQSA